MDMGVFDCDERKAALAWLNERDMLHNSAIVELVAYWQRREGLVSDVVEAAVEYDTAPNRHAREGALGRLAVTVRSLQD